MTRTNGELRVLIADDHPVFRKGLQQVIDAEPGLRVIGEASDGVEAIALIESLDPDVAVVDIGMPKLGGFDVTRSVREKGLQVKILFLTMYSDEEMFNAAMDLGVKGYMIKDSAVVDIVGAIRAVAAGQHYVSSSISGYLVSRLMPGDPLSGMRGGLDLLTPTERRIMKLIAESNTSKEIAEALNISVRTVENHRWNMCTKLDLRGSHALVRFALEHKSQLA